MKKAVLHFLMFGAFALLSQFAIAQTPTISSLSVTGGSSTNNDLTCNYTMNGSTIETSTVWYNNTVSTNTLYLPFEGGATNALLDFSGLNHHGSTSGVPGEEPTWSSVGGHNGNGALIFDGNDYLEVGTALPSGSYTKTAWINIATAASGFRNIISSESNADRNHHFKVDPNGELNAGHSFGFSIVTDPDSMFHDQWYFVAVSYESANGIMTLYKDGVEVDRAIVPAGLESVSDRTVQIGAKNDGFEWEGSIDEARIYNSALSYEQIQSLHTTGKDLLSEEETSGGETWYAAVTPFSASAVGSTSNSNSINVIGAEVSGLSLSASSPGNLTIHDLSASFSVNSHTEEAVSAWYRNGSPFTTLYLPFEGGSINGLLDFSGNDNHAFRSMDRDFVPSWSPSGGRGFNNGAYYFDGNDYLEVADALPLSASYTKTAWVNLMTTTGYRNIMSSIRFDDNNHCFKIDPDGTLHAGHSFGSNMVSDPNPVTTGTWHFVAVSFDFESGEMILYRDGAEVDRATVPLALRDVVDPSVLVGAMAHGFEFLGNIDEARVYAHVLSEEQISAMYTSGTNVIDSEETYGGDTWHVEVTAISETDIGNTLISNSVSLSSLAVTAISNQTIQEGSTFNPIDLDVHASDYDYLDSELEWTVSGNSNLDVTIDPVSHVATITNTDVDWYGSEDITFIATSPSTESDNTEATFTVTNVNDAPVLTVIGDQSTDEDVDRTGLSVVFSDADPSDSHSITVVSSDPNVSMQSLSGHTSSSTYILVPADDWFGSTQITVTVTDNGSGPLSDTEIYTFEVLPVNDEPVLTIIGNQDTDEDTDLEGLMVSYTDVDALDDHSISVVSGSSNVTVANISGDASGSTYNLVPAEDWNGSAQITVTVTDDGDGPLSDTEIYTLTVDPVNDAPVIGEIGNQFTFEDENLTGLTVDFTDPDAGDAHTISVVSLESNVTVVGPSGNISGSTYNLVPAPNWIGTAQITVTVTESGAGGLSDTEIYALEVGAINDAPVLITVGNQTIDEDNSVIGLSVVFSDLDPSDDHLITVVSSETEVTVANLIGNTSGSTYDLVPEADWNGSAQITVTVTDNGTGELSDTEIFTLTVDAVNDAPASINLSNDAVDEGVSVGTVVGMLSSIDPDQGNTHTYAFMFEGGDEEIDNQFFKIDGDELKVNSEMDYERKNTFALLVQSDDGQGGTLTQQIPVTVNNIVEVGIGDENVTLSMKVYPVPAFDRLTVELDNPENSVLLMELYSNIGVLVHSEHTVHGNTIDLNEFSKGMYILRIQGEGIFETRKIIVGDR